MPNLADYDLILANISGGKDSQAMLDLLVELAHRAAVAERVVAVHADLGRAEWEGTREIAHTHAKAYGLRFISIARPQGDLLEHIAERGMFPSSKARYCTSDHKRGQVSKVITGLVDELRRAGNLGDPPRQARILSAMGIRAGESPARAGKQRLATDTNATSGRRHVETYLPILDYTEKDVWRRIRRSDVPYHYAYDLGMKRVSCCFCVLAGKESLVEAARRAPELAERYRQLEKQTGHTIKANLSMDEIIAAAGAPVYEQTALFDTTDQED